MATFVFPTSAELAAIEQVYLPKLQKNSPAFDMFPDKPIDASILIWEQKDNYQGLQQIRGKNGAPPRVAKTGIKQYMMEPGVYGEFEEVDERELTDRRRMGSFAESIDISDLVRQIQDKLLSRRITRQEYLIWQLLCNGQFEVLDAKGSVLHSDGYTQRTFVATTTWGTFATSTPLADLRAIKLLHRGYSVAFDNKSNFYMNEGTRNNALSNTNAADIGGRRTQGFATINTPEDFDRLTTGDGLPTLTSYDEGYYDDSGVFQKWIPDNFGVVCGRRLSGTPIGNFGMTRNANNPDAAPGPYMRVIDRTAEQVPRTIEVHDGYNGSPIIYFPSAIIAATL